MPDSSRVQRGSVVLRLLRLRPSTGQRYSLRAASTVVCRASRSRARAGLGRSKGHGDRAASPWADLTAAGIRLREV